jgi:sulfur-oxidizing protein SoxB
MAAHHLHCKALCRHIFLSWKCIYHPTKRLLRCAHFDLKNRVKSGSPEAYAFTYNNFEDLAAKYGKTGGFGQIKTVLDSLRESAGGVQNTLTLDGGDTWQGSGTSLWTRGADMVEACNLLGVDVMVGHWEFTYKEKEVLKNVGFFKGDFLGQNVRILEDALLGDKYISMTEKYDGRGLYNEDDALPFKP